MLTAGQIPTACEVTYATRICSKSPVTHTLEGRVYHFGDESKVIVRYYSCNNCASRPSTVRSCVITPLSEYELEVAS